MQRSRWTPWIGLVAPPVAWAVYHQVHTNLAYYDCRLGGAPLLGAVGAVMALICLTSALISFASRPDNQAMEYRVFAGFLGAISGAVFFLALVVQTLATLMLPVCQP